MTGRLPKCCQPVLTKTHLKLDQSRFLDVPTLLRVRSGVGLSWGWVRVRVSSKGGVGGYGPRILD